METLASLNEVQLARCQAALALLRQEVTLTAAGATKADVACRRTYPYALAAFNQLHDWGNAGSPGSLSGLAEAAFVAYLAREMAIPVTGRLEDLKAVDAIFQRRLQEARVHALTARLRENTDPVLAELLANFKADDAALANAFDVYTARRAAVTAAAEAEVAAAHDWPALEGDAAAALETLKAAAVRSLALERLAVVCGCGEDAARRHRQEAGERIHAARVYALEREPLEDATAQETAALLRPMQGMEAAALPRSLKARIAELLPAARDEVLGAHRWNFARVGMPCCPKMEPNGDSLVLRPADCVRVEAVRTADGQLAEWSVRGPFIVTRGQPIAYVTYIRRLDDADRWPPALRRVLACRIAADIAGPGAQRFEAMYRERLTAAKVLDAREGNPGRAAWGKRRFTEAFR